MSEQEQIETPEDQLDIVLLSELVDVMKRLPEEARGRVYEYLHDRFPAPQATSERGDFRYGPGPFGVGLYQTPLDAARARGGV